MTLTPPPGVQRSESGRQAQVREAGGVRRRHRVGGLGDDPRAAHRIERAGREQVVQGVAGRPLHHDVGVVPVVLDVEDLRQPGVGQPAGGARRGDDLAQPRETGRESEHGDRAGQRLVDGLPGSPASSRGDPVLKPVPAAEPRARLRRERAHMSCDERGGSRASLLAP